ELLIKIMEAMHARPVVVASAGSSFGLYGPVTPARVCWATAPKTAPPPPSKWKWIVVGPTPSVTGLELSELAADLAVFGADGARVESKVTPWRACAG